MCSTRNRTDMDQDRAALASFAVGGLAAAVAVSYALTTDLVGVPESPGLPLAAPLVAAAVLAVPFGVGTAAAYLALRYRVVSPLVLVAAFAALPTALEWTAEQAFVAALVVGPLAVVAALGDVLVRAHLGQPGAPSRADADAVTVGVAAAAVYAGVFAVRAAMPMWYLEAGAPSPFPPAVDLPLVLWYLLGVSVVLVGLPVASNRRFGLLAPLFGLLAYLLVDLAFVQPRVAAGADLVVLLFVAVWPTLAVLLAGVGAVEWYLRDRRGEFEDGGGEGGEGDGDDRGFSLEGGLFGDRV